MNLDTNLLDSEDSPRWSSPTIAIVSVILLLLTGLALFAFRIVLVPLLVGAIIAYIFRPLVRSIHRRTGLSRGISSAILYLLLLVILVPSLILLIPSLVTLLQSLRQEIFDLVRLINEVSPDSTIVFLGWEFNAQTVADEVNGALANFARSLAAQSLNLVGRISRIILLSIFTILISFYLTRDAPIIVRWLEDLIPRSYRRDAQLLKKELDKVWSAFFRGQVILSLVVTVILTVLSASLGLPHPLLMGIWGGMLEFLPSIGNIVWGTTAILAALIQGSTYLPVSNTTFALIVFGVYVVFAQVDINILIPNIIGRHVRLHPMVVIIGVIIGIQVGGVLGVALAAPAIASLRILGRYIYAKLFHMYPFPMVGPPSAPWRERLAAMEHPVTDTDLNRSQDDGQRSSIDKSSP